MQGEYLKYDFEHRCLRGQKKRPSSEIKIERLQEKKPVKNGLLHCENLLPKGFSFFAKTELAPRFS